MLKDAFLEMMQHH